MRILWLKSDLLLPLDKGGRLRTGHLLRHLARRHAETKRGRLERALYRTQYQRMLRFEQRTLARFDGVLTVSAADRDTLERLYPDSLRARPWVVPAGVDTEYFAPAANAGSSPHLV